MNVYLFAFSKKKNSTAQPTLSAGTSFTVTLKEDTSVLNPVIVFNAATTGMPTPFTPSYFNYAYISAFNRYYYVTDWVNINALWECHLTVDALASFKTGIGSLSEYVIRSASNYNGYITDGLYPTHTNLSIDSANCALNTTTSGFYMLGVICKDNADSIGGAVTYYIMTKAQLSALKAYLMSDSFITDNGLNNLSEISSGMVKVIYNPFQYIVSCKFFPFAPVSSSIYTTENIKFGWWDIPVQGGKLQSGGYVHTLVSANISTAAHPQAAARGSYLNHAPYTEKYIIHPLIGTILLDTNKIDAGDTLTVNMSVDTITGQATVEIFNSTQQIALYENIIQLAIDIPLAQINTDVIGMARTAVESTGRVINNLTSLNVAGAITSAATGVLNTLEASIPILQANGVMGNMAMYNIPAKVYTVYRQLVNEDYSHRGRPLCEVKTINTLSGFIMCADAHAELSCFDSERSTIVNYMNNGFYYE